MNKRLSELEIDIGLGSGGHSSRHVLDTADIIGLRHYEADAAAAAAVGLRRAHGHRGSGDVLIHHHRSQQQQQAAVEQAELDLLNRLPDQNTPPPQFRQVRFIFFYPAT